MELTGELAKMKTLILILCLVSTSCLAQDMTAQQRVESTLGKLIIENANLASTNDALNKQIVDLKKQIEDKEKKDK
jgi:cell division protein FtsB